jgi:steroid delta-isomerase-like uncharacterized protein
MSLDDLKRLVCQHIDLSWNKGRLALTERLHSKDFLYKSSFIGRPLNSSAFTQMVHDIRLSMPDLQVVVEECIAEGNKVVTWSTLIGTIEKPAFGYPPSDKVLSISAMAFWTLTPSGEIQEICTMFDMESFRAQQGLAIQALEEKALP